MYTSKFPYSIMTTCSLKFAFLDIVLSLSRTVGSCFFVCSLVLGSILCWDVLFDYFGNSTLHFDFVGRSPPLKHARLHGERLNLISCAVFLAFLFSAAFSAVKFEVFLIILLLLSVKWEIMLNIYIFSYLPHKFDDYITRSFKKRAFIDYFKLMMQNILQTNTLFIILSI